MDITPRHVNLDYSSGNFQLRRGRGQRIRWAPHYKRLGGLEEDVNGFQVQVLVLESSDLNSTLTVPIRRRLWRVQGSRGQPRL
jgi:hypothetical protein